VITTQARLPGFALLPHQTSSRVIFFSQLRAKIERSPSQASNGSEQTKYVGVDVQRLQARSFTFQRGRSYALMASASHSALLGSLSREGTAQLVCLLVNGLDPVNRFSPWLERSFDQRRSGCRPPRSSGCS
jgi:hypothetical protein